MSRPFNRRALLRGVLGGAAINVGLPLLDCFLNEHGTALANAQPVPVRFGTWVWGLGMNKQIFTPDKVGPDYDLKDELAAIKPVKEQINLFSHYRVLRDGRPSLCHYTGWVVLRCGQAPLDRNSYPAESIDVTVSDAIGGNTRFRSLEMAATGNKAHSYSFRNAQAVNPPEVSPLDFYQRIFGGEFQDPNAASFKPNPQLMLRKSVLSAVKEDSAQLQKQLGSEDRRRLDQYFTSLRGLEQRLALQLEKPAPAQACHRPGEPPPEITASGEDVELLSERHRLMTDILVNALACNQTRVFNMLYSVQNTTKQGESSTHHVITHEESLNPQGWQEKHSWFVRRAMQEWAYFVGALASVREGDRTLLDNTLVYAHSDQEFAKYHTEEGIPMMTAGRAGGRIKSGVHVDGRHEAVASQVVLTLLQAMGLERYEWGVGSMRATQPVGGILV